MIGGISIQVDDRAALARLSGMASTRSRALVREAIGIEANDLLRRHFYDLHRARSRGAQGSGFYAGAADTVFHLPTSEGVIVGSSRRGLRQRYLGGPIRPGPGKRFLTIPVHPSAYGKRAKDPSLPPLTLISTGRPGVMVLSRAGRGGFFVPYFVLVPQVFQNPDPTVLPSEATLREVATRAAAVAMREVMRRGEAT